MSGGNKDPRVGAERVGVEVGAQVIAVEGQSIVGDINVEDDVVSGLAD